jgi:hypothetical protein
VRTTAFAALVALVVEYGLGAAVTLRGASRALIGAHIALGLLLLIAAVVLLVRAILARRPASIACGAIGLLAILAAVDSGFGFLRSGDGGAALGMALAAGVAMLAYASALFVTAR